MMKQLAVQELAALCAVPAAADAPVLLDVREPWEFALAAIRLDGAQTLHIPMNEVPARLAEIGAAGVNIAQATAQTIAKTARPIVCICHHGVRSAQVVAFLERQGLAPVYNLAGGIEAWSTEVDHSVPRY
jgi:rhodanese-related sulfurtransferase